MQNSNKKIENSSKNELVVYESTPLDNLDILAEKMAQMGFNLTKEELNFVNFDALREFFLHFVA